MGNSSCNSASRGIKLQVLLAIIFVVLKLCHVIDWSWWWIMAPLWVPLALAFGLLLILFAMTIKKNKMTSEFIKQ